jgi:hypothetical protein
MNNQSKEKKVTVSVTAEDIARGLKFDPRECPVAHAMRRAFRRKMVSAGGGMLRLGKGGEVSWYTPVDVRKFICDFDCGETVTPFKFELSDPRA